MINELTEKQKSKLSEYRDKWLNIGLSTEWTDRHSAIRRWHEFDKTILGNDKSVPVIFMDSPLSTWIATVYLYIIYYGGDQVWSQVLDQVESQIRNQVDSQVERQVRNQVDSQVESQVLNQVWSQIGNQVWNQVDSQVRSQVGRQVDSQVRNQVDSQVERQVWSQVWSQVLDQVSSQVLDQVKGQVWSQVWNQVGRQIDSQVRSQIESQVLSQVWSQVDSQVRSQVESQVESQVSSQVRSQVESQVESQVGNQIDSQVRSQIESQVESQVRSQVWNQVDSQVRSQIESQVLSQVWSQVGNQVWSQVGGQVRSQVESQVWSQVWDQVRRQVRSQVESQVKNFVYPYLNLQYWAGYFGYYDFINKELNVKFENQKEWDLLVSLKDLSWIYPFKDFCVISEKPTKINMRDRLLHCDGGASVEYADGFKVWSLNGIRVPQYLAETPSERLEISFFEKERNADIKTEFVRKYGVDRLLNLGKKIDDWKKYNDEWWTKSEYELWDLGKIFNLPHAYHIKMLNQSVDGVFHVEAVAPECDSLPKAIQYRLKGKSNKIINIK